MTSKVKKKELRKSKVQKTGGMAKTVKSKEFYSVEFFVDKLFLLVQFKIWNTQSKPMFVLVKESSEIISHLQVGDVINMRYYSYSSSLLTIELETEIEYIVLDKNQRFRGHYLVGLKILQLK